MSDLKRRTLGVVSGVKGDALASVSKDGTIERHTMSVLVDNESGVLARVIGLFSGRGYNIESLTVAEVDPLEHLSRITIVTSGTPMIIEQIKNQDRKSTRLNSSHIQKSRMPSSA